MDVLLMSNIHVLWDHQEINKGFFLVNRGFDLLGHDVK